MIPVMIIDAETLGLEAITAPILSFGYIVGDLATGKITEEKEFIIPEKWNIEHSTFRGFNETMLWWIDQAEKNGDVTIELKSYLEEGQHRTIHGLHYDLQYMIGNLTQAHYVFSTDKSFDNILLDRLLVSQSMHSIRKIVPYKKIQETRLLSEVLYPKHFTKTLEEGEIAHTPITDCKLLFRALHSIQREHAIF